MENKIMFLIIVILCLYLLFSEKGQQIIRNITGQGTGGSLDSNEAVNEYFNGKGNTNKKYSGEVSGNNAG